MKFAYADPPYIGQAKRHYDCAEIDHAELIERLQRDFHDGWALSLSSPTLKNILPLCPPEARVMVWVKPFVSFKPNVPVAYAWEPVIVVGGRKRPKTKPTMRDWIDANITMQRGTHGAKPERFCFWLFEVLGAQEGDEFHDLFYGSGAVSVAWEKWLLFNHLTPPSAII